MDYYILIKNTGIKMRVSQRTFYKIVNEEPGRYVEKNYEITIDVLKKYPRLYNRARKI